MKTLLKHRKPLAATLILAMAVVSVPVLPARAGLVGTDQVIQQIQGTDRDRIVTFLSREDVQAQLKALGVSPTEAKARVGALSDEEVARINGRLDELPAGKGAIGALVGAAVIIFLVLVITDLLGLTQVFGFTRKGSLSPN